MIFDVYSDLHIDSWNNGSHHVLGAPIIPSHIRFIPSEGSRFAILAGDAGNGLKFIEAAQTALEGLYERVFICHGNHDFYGHDIIDHLYNDRLSKVYEFEGKVILSTPLWTNFRNNHNTLTAGILKMVKKGIIDYSKTDYGCELLEPTDTIRLFDKSVTFLKDEKRRHKKIDIVVTHWPPLLNSLHESYQKNPSDEPYNHYFVNDLPDLVKEISPTIWVHGHTHKPFDYEWGETRVIANPLGYNGENQRPDENGIVNIIPKPFELPV